MRGGIIWGGAVLSLGLFLAGCGDPLSEVPRYSDVSVAADAGQADALAPETSRTPATNAPPRRGLMGLFGARAAAAKGGPVAPEPGAEDPQAQVAAAPAPVRREVSGGRSAARSGLSGEREVPLGANLAFGEVARVCGVSPGQLGRKVESYPARGSGYDLYDSAPGTTSAHSFFLTGFKDGCARQFTAALVILGSPESYEQIHYGPSGDTQPLSETDKAYERIKRKVCGVSQGKPCGSKMRKLARDTAFVSVYERFGSNPRWKNILLHDGEVAAVDLKN